MFAYCQNNAVNMSDPNGYWGTHAMEVWDGYNDEYTSLVTTTKKVGMGTGLAASGILIAIGAGVSAAIVAFSELPIAYGAVSSSALVPPAIKDIKDAAIRTHDVIIGAIDNGIVTKSHLLMGENILNGHDEFLEGTERGFSLLWRAKEGVFKVVESGTVSRIGNKLINSEDVKAIKIFFGID